MFISVRVPDNGMCVHISGDDLVWYVFDVLFAVLNVCVSCFVVRVCAVSRRYIDVCNCDVFSVVNVYLDHVKSVLRVFMVEGISVVVNVILSLTR